MKFKKWERVMIRKDIKSCSSSLGLTLTESMKTLGGNIVTILNDAPPYRVEATDGGIASNYKWEEEWLVPMEESCESNVSKSTTFKVGDLIQIRKDISDTRKYPSEAPGIDANMRKLGGCMGYITDIDSYSKEYRYRVNLQGLVQDFWWLEKWITNNAHEEPSKETDVGSSCCRVSEITKLSYSIEPEEKHQKIEGGKSTMANVQVTFKGNISVNRLMYLKGGLVTVPEEQVVSYPNLTDIIAVKTPLENIKEGDIIQREEDGEYYAVKEIIPGGYKALSFKTRTTSECAVTSAPEFPTLLNKVSYSAAHLPMEKIIELGAYGSSSGIGRGIAEELGRRLAGAAIDAMKQPTKSAKV